MVTMGIAPIKVLLLNNNNNDNNNNVLLLLMVFTIRPADLIDVSLSLVLSNYVVNQCPGVP